MSDFYQGSTITTLHRLNKENLQILENELMDYTKTRPIALVLPALFSDLKTDAAKNIIKTLKDVKYINEIIITLGKANKDEFKEAKKILHSLPQNKSIIWNDGENIQKLYKLLEENGFIAIEDGKGRSCWISYGYILAEGRSDIIVLHDCDIITYSRDFLARLVYPIANPKLGFEFCKGYYPRVSNKLHGRVTRLFVFPLVKALIKIFGLVPFLEFLDDFRYPLAGEFSMITDLARVNRIPYDWGLEVGVLAEVFKNVSPKRVCQVELCENYDHKHQNLSPDDSSTGLHKMAIDIAKSIFRTLLSEGIIFTDHTFRTIRLTYLTIAREMMERYSADAMIDSLIFERHEEGKTIETFYNAIDSAASVVIKSPWGAEPIPNWNRVTSAIPDFFERLKGAVEEDSDEFT